MISVIPPTTKIIPGREQNRVTYDKNIHSWNKYTENVFSHLSVYWSPPLVGKQKTPGVGVGAENWALALKKKEAGFVIRPSKTKKKYHKKYHV